VKYVDVKQNVKELVLAIQIIVQEKYIMLIVRNFNVQALNDFL